MLFINELFNTRSVFFTAVLLPLLFVWPPRPISPPGISHTFIFSVRVRVRLKGQLALRPAGSCSPSDNSWSCPRVSSSQQVLYGIPSKADASGISTTGARALSAGHKAPHESLSVTCCNWMFHSMPRAGENLVEVETRSEVNQMA